MLKMGVPVATPIKQIDIFKSILGIFNPKKSLDYFNEKLQSFLGIKKILFFGSGREAIYYCIFNLSKISNKKEVIIPAFICPSVPNAIRKAGLKPILCDIELGSYSIEKKSIERVLSDDTIAILKADLYGFPSEVLKYPNIFSIEDCAQSFGAEINGKKTGLFGDFSIFSFGMSKVLSLYGGGALGINSNDLISFFDIKQNKNLNLINQIFLFFKIFILNLIVKSKYNGVLDYIWKKKYQRKDELTDFKISPFYSIRAKLGQFLLDDFEEITIDRKKNYDFYSNYLENFRNILIPMENPNSKPVFLRYPVLVKEVEKRKKILKCLREVGINVSEMYDRISLNKILSISEKRTEIPNVEYAVERMVVLPLHSFLNEKEKDKIIEIFRRNLK